MVAMVNDSARSSGPANALLMSPRNASSKQILLEITLATTSEIAAYDSNTACKAGTKAIIWEIQSIQLSYDWK
jgi:hypothetical protein